MRSLFFGLCYLASILAIAQEADTLVRAEGKITNAETGEPLKARIVYESLPYGNRIGVINNSVYSFPMFDREHYSITVEAPGFAPAKYLLDPSAANDNNKVILHIRLSAGAKAMHAAGKVMRLNNLIFEVGKSRIDPESFSELDVLANLMVENPGMVIQLEGHTDFLGDSKANLKLSQQRVDAVRSYLAAKDIAKSRIKTKAFGGSQPLSRDNTPEAHRLNRRVEVRILQN